MNDERDRLGTRPTGALTALFAVSCFVAIAIFQSLTVLGVGGPLAQKALPMMGEAVIEVLAVIVIAIAAYRMRQRTSRIVWALIALGVLGATVGDALWIRDLLVNGQTVDSNAGFAWYVLEYLSIPAACGIYAFSLRDRVDLTWPIVESTAAAALGMSAVWFFVMRPLLQVDPQLVKTSPGALYVLADYPLFVMPTLMVLLTVMRVRERGILVPWLLFGAGMLLVVLADVGWFWEQASGTWEPGSLVDFAFMGGHVLIATGAMSFLINEIWLRSQSSVGED